MKKYIAIGYWKEAKGNVMSVASHASSKKNMKDNCNGNDFVAWAVFSEKDVKAMKEMESRERFEAVKKATSYYGHWLMIDDYIDQCIDIMEERLAAVE